MTSAEESVRLLFTEKESYGSMSAPSTAESLPAAAAAAACETVLSIGEKTNSSPLEDSKIVDVHLRDQHRTVPIELSASMTKETVERLFASKGISLDSYSICDEFGSILPIDAAILVERFAINAIKSSKFVFFGIFGSDM